MSTPTAPVPHPLKSFADVQAWLTECEAFLNSDPADAPHGSFWNTLSYKEFTTGNVPGISASVRILVPGDGDNASIIALEGKGPLFGPSGQYGQMPADGPPFFDQAWIDPVKAWINANCPQ